MSPGVNIFIFKIIQDVNTQYKTKLNRNIQKFCMKEEHQGC